MLKEERNATKQDVIDYVKLKILNQAAAKVSWLQDLLFSPRVKRLNETSGLPFFFFLHLLRNVVRPSWEVVAVGLIPAHPAVSSGSTGRVTGR